MKVITIVGTRPEIIRLSEIIKKLDIFTDHVIAHTGQNYDYELNQIFFEELGLRNPDFYLNCAGDTAAETIGNVINESDKLMRKIKPDALVILGDTNSCLSAISAKRLKIPIFHLEAGNRCFDMNVPEEINRKIVDSISDVNLTYSSIAREYLISEGFPANRIIKIGSPIREVCSKYMEKIDSLNAFEDYCVKKGEYFLVSLHREENVDDENRLVNIFKTIEQIIENYKYPVILSLHPRTKKNIENFKIKIPELVITCKPFGYIKYLSLQKNSFVTLSDSGTITEEANIIGFHAVNFRGTHERPEGFEEGAVILSGFEQKNIIDAINVTVNTDRPNPVGDYEDKNISDKVIKIILSYSHFVNRYVWNK
jgi:UDP-N-acetylglucosamine 2-epimerase